MRRRVRVLLAAAVLVGTGAGGVSWVMGDGVASSSLSQEQVKGLIEKLGSDDFATREKARQELVAAGAGALSALEGATKSSDVEVAQQAKGAVVEIHRAMSAAASAEIEKQQLWCYGMEKGAAWTISCDWPVIFGETGYVVGGDWKLHAVDMKTGQGRWAVDLGVKGPVGATGSQVSAGASVVTRVQDQMLTVYDTKEGKELWKKDLKPANEIGGLPAKGGGGGMGGGNAGAGAGVRYSRPEAWVVGEMVVARAGDEIKGYKGASGEEAWHMDVPQRSGMCNTVWEKGVAYLSKDQAVAALDVTGQKELWSKDMPGCVRLLKGGETLVCAVGTKVVALDCKKGGKLWEAELVSGMGGGKGADGGEGNGLPPGVMQARMALTGAMLSKKMAVDEKRLYVVMGETLATYDLKTGSKSAVQLDSSEQASGGMATNAPANPGGGAAGGLPPGTPTISYYQSVINQTAAGDGTFYGVTSKGIIAFNGKSGARLWMLPLKSNLVTEPLVTGGVLYFVTNGGRVLAGQDGNSPQDTTKPGQSAADAAAEAAVTTAGLHAIKVVK